MRGNRGAQVRSTPEFTSSKEGGEPSKHPPASVTHAEMPSLCQAGLRCSMLIPLHFLLTQPCLITQCFSVNVGASENNPVPRCSFYSRGALWNLPPLWFILPLPWQELKAMAADPTVALRGDSSHLLVATTGLGADGRRAVEGGCCWQLPSTPLNLSSEPTASVSASTHVLLPSY